MTRAAERVLSRELLLRLMPPVLALVALTAALGAYSAKQLADHVFDRWLLDASRSLAGQVHFDADGRPLLRLPAEAQAMLLFDDVDRTWFSVQADGRLLAGQPGLPTSGDDEAVHSPHGRAFGGTVEGRAVRIAREDLNGPHGAHVTVLVAETLGKRERASAWLRDMLWPMAALVLATGLAIVLAVRATVRPLEQIAARWRRQSAASLETIEAGDVPRELVPFASALNGLLGRLRGLLERERQFSSVAAHQLRTPLAGLQLGLARAREAGDLDTVRAVLGELEQTTQRTARVVQQLLALGRLNPEGDGAVPGPPVDLVALAQEVGAAQADTALARGLDLELDAPETPVFVPGHADLLAEALANLLDNAIRYTPAGGRIVVRVHDAPPALGVDDSGPGIPEDEREAVQQRFVRGRRASGEGSGLGLAIVRDVAALHGARLELGDGAWGGLRAELRFDALRPTA